MCPFINCFVKGIQRGLNQCGSLMSLVFANFFAGDTQPLHTMYLYNSHILWRCLLILTLGMSWLGRYICRAFQIFISILSEKCLDIPAETEMDICSYEKQYLFVLGVTLPFSESTLIVLAISGLKNCHVINSEMFTDSKNMNCSQQGRFSPRGKRCLIVVL